MQLAVSPAIALLGIDHKKEEKQEEEEDKEQEEEKNCTGIFITALFRTTPSWKPRCPFINKELKKP